MRRRENSSCRLLLTAVLVAILGGGRLHVDAQSSGDGFATCAANIYRCFSSTLQLPLSQLQPSMCRSNSSCVMSAAATCPATFALAGQELARASYLLYRSNCDQKYCFSPLQICVGNPFLTGYTSNNFAAYCRSYSDAAASCRTPDCSNLGAVTSWKADLASLCVSGGQCYQAAITCISYAYFDPQVQDLTVICQNASTATSCITNVLRSSSCTGASSSIVTAVNSLLNAYLTKCDIGNVCNQTLATCLSSAVSSDIPSSQFASSVCSYLAGIQTCLNANPACQGRYTGVVTQLKQYCASQLCAAGVQFCYDSFAFNATLLQTGTVTDYLQSWCQATTTIQTCLVNHNTLCDVIGYNFQATVGSALDSLCTLGRTPADAAGVGCYWTALNCLYANGVVQYNTPTKFWVPQSTDYCTAVSYNKTSTCLSTARSQCSGTSAVTYQQAIDNVNYAFTTSCTPACSTAGKQTCQDALTYYLSQMLNGSRNLCSMLNQPHTCFGMQIKGCTSLTDTVKASNVAILNSLFVAISQICSSLTPPNGTTTCVDGVVQCLVKFFGGITGNTNFNTQSDICQNWTSTKTCIAAAQSTCSGSTQSAIKSIVQAVSGVLNSLKPCNPATTCNLQVSIDCEASLSTEIDIANSYMLPVDYKGKKRNVFCRKDLDGSAAISNGFQGDDDDDESSVPFVCNYPKFYWGSLCVNINSTLSCIGEATLNCTGAIQLSQKAALQESASAYISSCTRAYLCKYDAAVEAIQDLVQFGLQSQFKNVRNQRDNFCYWLSDISLSIWNSASQCTPFVSEYLWQFVEAYLEIVADNCKPRQIICSKKCPPPRSSWDTPLPPDCNMDSIQSAFMSFFSVVWTQSISVTPDLDVIASSLATLQSQLQIIQAGYVSNVAGSCQWAAEFTSLIIIKFQTIIDIIISPPTCFISDAYDCVAGLQNYIAKKGLAGAGNINKKQREKFCRVATNTFTCISTATVDCTAAQQKAVFDMYYELQDLVGYVCQDRCTSNPCQNDGMCSTGLSPSETVTPPARCQCNPGYFGDNCETSTCSYADLLNCVNPVVNLLLSGDISGLGSVLTNAGTCLNNLDDDCQYDFSFEITIEIIVQLNVTLAVTTTGCKASAINACLRPPYVQKPSKLFDSKTKFLSKDVCKSWTAVQSCLQKAGCSVNQTDSIADYFGASCEEPPPSTCPVREVAEKVNRCGHKFKRIKYGKPRPKKKVRSPEKELGRCRKKYKPENVPPDNDNELDENGLNLDLDVCGELGDSWSEANETANQCKPGWSEKVRRHLAWQSQRYVGNGQCDDPCDKDKCAYGSTCVPNVDPPVGYTCVCLPGWSGRYCDEAPTPTCQTQNCPNQLLNLLNDIIANINAPSPASCSQLSAVSTCLSTDLYPCGDNYAADATLLIQFINFVTSTICATPPTGTCEVKFLSGCIKTMLNNLYVNVDEDDNECMYRQTAAFCLTSVEVVCSANGAFFDVLFELSSSAVSQYVTSCQPSECNVEAVIDCLTPLQYATGFQLVPSGSDTCSTGATAVSCVRQATSNCPPWLTAQINDLLSSLLNNTDEQPSPGPGGDICSTTPCQNGGTCTPDSSSPNNFMCACAQGFTGDYCEFVGCNPSKVPQCISLLLPVLNVQWTGGCPTVDCSLLESAADCFSAASNAGCDYTLQADQLVNIVNGIRDQLCGASAPACGAQPASCPTSQIRQCFLQYVNLAFIDAVSEEEGALEFGMPLPSLGGDKTSVACVNQYIDPTNTQCNSDFQTVLGTLLGIVDNNFVPNQCNLKYIGIYKNYVQATVPLLQAQPSLPVVVQQSLCRLVCAACAI